MLFLDKLETYVTKPSHLSRRSALGWLTRNCAGLCAIVAGTNLQDQAYAANVACCNLIDPNPKNYCKSDYYRGVCPCKAQPYEWQCKYFDGLHTCVWICGECYSCSCSYAYQLCSGTACPCAPGAPSLEEITTKFLPLRTAGECHMRHSEKVE